MSPRRILIVQTAFIGDVILITPLIRETRRLFPEARIDALVTPQTRPILENNPHLEAVLTFDKRGLKAWAFLATAWAVRRGSYDLAISPHSSLTTSWLLRLGGIPERLGFDRWRQARSLTLKVSTEGITQRVDKNLHLLSVFGARDLNRSTELFPGEAERRAAETLLAGSPTPRVALAPGSVWNTKRWPADHYVDVCRALHAEGLGLVFVGAPEERELCEAIATKARVPAVHAAGELSLLGSAALLARCNHLLCNDSGALHLANAVGTPVTALFGPTVRRLGYFPLGDHDRVFEVDGLDCRPCGRHGHEVCPQGHFKCMLDLAPTPVAAHILGSLGVAR